MEWNSAPEVGRDCLVGDHRDGFVEAHHLLPILGAETAKRDRALVGLALADDQQQRDLGEADARAPLVDLLVAEVGLDANARRRKLLRHLPA